MGPSGRKFRPWARLRHCHLPRLSYSREVILSPDHHQLVSLTLGLHIPNIQEFNRHVHQLQQLQSLTLHLDLPREGKSPAHPRDLFDHRVTLALPPLLLELYVVLHPHRLSRQQLLVLFIADGTLPVRLRIIKLTSPSSKVRWELQDETCQRLPASLEFCYPLPVVAVELPHLHQPSQVVGLIDTVA